MKAMLTTSAVKTDHNELIRAAQLGFSSKWLLPSRPKNLLKTNETGINFAQMTGSRFCIDINILDRFSADYNWHDWRTCSVPIWMIMTQSIIVITNDVMLVTTGSCRVTGYQDYLVQCPFNIQVSFSNQRYNTWKWRSLIKPYLPYIIKLFYLPSLFN